MAADFLSTPIGDLWVFASEAKLLKIGFEKGAAFDKNDITKRTVELLDAYFMDMRPDFSKLPFEFPGQPFYRRTLKALLKTDYGTRLTYGDLAELAGNKNAYRAAASAVSHNPFAIAVPCHRVVHKSGGVGAYGWGTAKKAWLLHHEGKQT
ncbi:MAG: methylated-DNA--[protein]-cysteine S-methyltransferase [Helicobacteraceae bacterium]|jgi:methylated-DNA-[protein]-cysteine S-methyltransferase|nr:methylated-DNA--[protein]-cysteine S-methyltransferase [Helicobacteraceae bacterium]